MVLILPLASYSQKDITQFLDIPVDGYKSEMLQKLKNKGFTSNKFSEDILEGEFNGTDVNLFIGTNNNKVFRISVRDINPSNETQIKIRFNNLIQQFVNNSRYMTQADSTTAKYTIPEGENIAYNISVKNKQYQATFSQKSLKFDSLTNEKNLLQSKEKLNEKELDRLLEIIKELAVESINSLIHKTVWFMIQKDINEYRIIIFYENDYNKAKGEGL
jgi:hypothetical protein